MRQRPFFLATVLLAVQLSAAAWAALPAGSAESWEKPGNELIVLLAAAPSAPPPEEVVARASQRELIPSGLDVGNPKIKLGISRRARGEERKRLQTNPQSPEARLQRYIVLAYPEGTDLDAVQRVLKTLPYVEHVQKSRIFTLSTVPSDPLLPKVFNNVSRDPEDHQWGTLILNLPAAWDYAKGHAYIGVLDGGLDIDHEDLAPFSSTGNYLGGNFREHLSIDTGDADNNVDERQGTSTVNAGHGTHVSGIIAATTNNGKGVAGTCWHCSLMMAKILDDSKRFLINEQDVSDALEFVIDQGAQVVNMSFGRPADTGCEDQSLDMFCTAVALAEQRGVTLVAASGNSRQHLQFPASDPRFIAVGGIEPPEGLFWDEEDDDGCPAITCSNDLDCECGSNFTVNLSRNPQTLVAPAADVLSTFYTDATWNNFGCFSVPDPQDTSQPKNYGLCTGTSMSAPFVTGIAGILRSVNPLLTRDQIESALTDYASRAGNWDTHFGYGIPNAVASVQAVLGRSNGTVLANRLTPLFALYSPVAQDHFYTTFPQMGAAALWSSGGYSAYKPGGGTWPDVPGYGYFPGAGCNVSPCLTEPGASVYIFTTDRSPNGHFLVPLYRMSFEGTFTGGPSNPDNRDVVYTTESAGTLSFRNEGYKLDGMEGYIYQRCTPEPGCIPAGAVRLYRRYNAARDDHAIFPESELAAMEADGYTQASGNDWIGYVYPNVDTDSDEVIDGFEGLIGTNAALNDSDCDGVWDGDEILGYPNTDPRVPNSGPGCDPKPVANFNWSCALRTCTFNSTSTDNQPIPSSNHRWFLGDGNEKTGSSITHTYAAGGPYLVKLRVTDSVGQPDDEDKWIAVNRPPVANGDSAITNRDVAVNINVLANDSDTDGDPITVSAWTQPVHGSETKNPDGTLRYTPATGYTGPDSFTYQAGDGRETSDSATVSLMVRVPNRVPDAREDGWRTYQNGPAHIPHANLLANDYDPDGDALAVTGINAAGLTGTLDCSFGTYCRYTPPSWFVGTTSYTYSAADGKGGTDPATVRIKVGVANNLPVPQDDVLETTRNTPLTFTRATLLVNDSDPDGDVLSVSQVLRAPLAGFGTVSCSAASYVCTYTPPAGFTGVDVLSYRATDGVDFTDARLRILVRPPSPAVLDAREDAKFFTTSGGTFLSYTWMTSNDYDPEGGALTVVGIDTTGLLGTLDCTTYSTGCQYTRGTSDPTRFRYTVRDPQGNQETATVTLKPGNWAFNRSPVVGNDQLSTRANTPLAFSVFDVLRNDYDPDNDQLNISFNFASTSGRVACTTPAYFCTYTPNANFTGTDTLTYYVNDGNNAVNGSVTMTVQPLIAKDAQILSQSVPVSLFAGRSYPVSLRIKNVGTQSWSPVGPQCNAYRLGSINPYDNTTWGPGRVELPAAVAPGGEVTLSFTITAPSTPGTYNFQRRMVHECVAWFGDLSPNVVVTVSQ